MSAKDLEPPAVIRRLLLIVKKKYVTLKHVLSVEKLHGVLLK